MMSFLKKIAISLAILEPIKLFDWNVSALCYDNLRFPMTTQVSSDTQMSQFYAIIGDADHLYSGGYSNSQGFNLYNGSATQQAVIVKIEQATRSYLWRRFYADSTGSMSEVTALALEPTNGHLAAVASNPAQTMSFIFVVDVQSGILIQKPAKINNGAAFSVKSPALKFTATSTYEKLILAFDN